MINHLPNLIRYYTFDDKKIMFSLEHFLDIYADNYDMFFCIWVATDKYNQDIGVDGNLAIPLSEIGKTFLTKDQYQAKHRDDRLKSLGI